MNLLLLKIGKAIKTIRRNGLINGGRRVCKGGIAMMQIVHPGDILIITGGIGDSALYRAYHQAEELKINGFRVSTTVQDNPFLLRYYRDFRVFIFHRVLHTHNIRRLVSAIKKNRKTMIFDTDDLIFDKIYLKHMDYFNQMNSMEKKFYENGVGGEILNNPYVTVCTTTTAFLANLIREKNKRVFIVPNKLSNQDLRWAEEIKKKPTTSNKEIVRIGYFSGSMSHNKDFATISDVLMEIMIRYPNIQLNIAGPLDIDSALLKKCPDKIIASPYVPRKKYFELLSETDINLAPLEINNPFCESKSELKFFEAGLMDVPTVAVRNHTFSRAIEDGVNGFLATKKSEWYHKIEMLILNKALRVEMGIRAHHSVLTNYTTRNASHFEYYNFLKSRINYL